MPIEISIMRSAPGPEFLYVCFVRSLTTQTQAQSQIIDRARELQRAQEQLRQSEQLYRQIVEMSGLCPWTANVEGNSLSLGARWAEWTGRPVHEALGDEWANFIHADDRQDMRRRWAETSLSGQSLDWEWRILAADGSFRWLRTRAVKRSDASGGVPIWYGTLEDIHDRRIASDAFQRAQAELVHVSRLSAMGAMGSAIAHDLNQPLTAVTHYVRGCRQLLASVEGAAKAEIEQGLDDADRCALRAGDIVRRVREFVARGHVETEPECIVDLIKGACKLALIDAKLHGIKWRTEFETRCIVKADRIQIQQVLVNLIRNSIEAMAGQPQRNLTIRVGPGVPGLCEIAVRDTGGGLSAEAAGQMFDPFYTTRKDGTGIGLSISRMIVQAHGGSIWYERNDGQGTTIKFTLPMDDIGNEQARTSAERV